MQGMSILKPAATGNWRVTGFWGERIDTMAKARLLDPEAWDIIYPETEEAFRLREDDKSHPGRGVWRGEFWGKYILSAVDACRYYSSDMLKEKIAKAVEGLLSTQDTNGYIGTYTDSAFFSKCTWNIWGRKYTLWGLLAAYELLQDRTILDAAERFANHLMSEVGPGKHNIIETGQFVGLPSTSILQPIVLLYRATNNKKYLAYAQYIVEQWSLFPDKGPDILNNGLKNKPVDKWYNNPDDWAKGYELMSSVEGLLELYKETGKDDYLTAVKNIHSNILGRERSPVGSVSFNDKFIGSNGLVNVVAELCDAVYWNRLSYELFLLTGDIKYIDEIERTLYNSLLCGISTDGSWGLRRLRMTHEHIPAHNHFLRHHQCCVDNMPRGLFQAAQSVLFTDKDGLYVALFNSGYGKAILSSGNIISIEIKGDLLNQEKISIQITQADPEEFDFNIRIPYWCKSITININGEESKTFANTGQWASIKSIWKSGYSISLTFNEICRMEYLDENDLCKDDTLVQWHKKQWADMGIMSEDAITQVYTQTKNVTLEDALPQKKAAVFFIGPYALSQDERLDDIDFYAISKIKNGIQNIKSVKRIKAPEKIRYAFEVELISGEKIKMCDFASAGNIWDQYNKFSTWRFVEVE